MPGINEFCRLISAASKFLSSIASLATFAEIESLQFQKVSKSLQASKVSDEDGVRAVGAIQQATGFSQGLLTELKQLVAEKVSQFEEKPGKEKKHKGPSLRGQDYSSLHRFLTPSLWKELEHPKVLHRCESLTWFAQELGLDTPTETTLATMVVLVNWNDWKDVEISQQEKYRIGASTKSQLRAMFKGKVSDETIRLDTLPAHPHQLPHSHTDLYTQFLCFKVLHVWR